MTPEKKLRLLQNTCVHPDTTKTEKYISGGYDYKSENIIYEHCTECRKLIRFYNDPRYHGHYG